MQLTDQIRNDMAAKGYVYWNDRNHPAKDGLRTTCQSLEGVDFDKVIFDTDAYRAHIESGFIQAHNAN